MRLDIDQRTATLHLIAIASLTLFFLLIIMDDIERLKRITAPHLIFVRDTPKENAPEAETAGAIEGEFHTVN